MLGTVTLEKTMSRYRPVLYTDVKRALPCVPLAVWVSWHSSGALRQGHTDAQGRQVALHWAPSVEQDKGACG